VSTSILGGIALSGEKGKGKKSSLTLGGQRLARLYARDSFSSIIQGKSFRRKRMLSCHEWGRLRRRAD